MCGKLSVDLSVVASALFIAGECWGEGIMAGESNRLNKLVRRLALLWDLNRTVKCSFVPAAIRLYNSV